MASALARRRLLLFAQQGDSGVTIDVDLATLTLTAFDPTVTAGAPVTINVDLAVLLLTGFGPTVFSDTSGGASTVRNRGRFLSRFGFNL